MKKVLIGFLILLLIAGTVGAYVAHVIWGENVALSQDSVLFTIPTGSSFDDIQRKLVDDGIVKNAQHLDWTSTLMKMKDRKIKAGQYTLQNQWSNRDLLQYLRSGKEEELTITINNVRTLEQMAGKASQFIEADSSQIIDLIKSKYIPEWNTTPEKALSYFIPNSYNVYWDTSADEFAQKMHTEWGKFWNEERRGKAAEINLSPEEVYTLASIVEKEFYIKEEKPRIAGVYINRLARNMMLQADPTVVYANGDFSLRRVLNKHLEFDSPYNTYVYEGLPIGPICMPEITTIDAVLNYESHKYLYFCANTNNTGDHLFAKTLAQHNVNARKYHQWLNKRKIK